ncbi:MAG: hypothetical protein KME30_14525 [Iphinoe sp. HA4291-MV1]|nr:hypothetical protein [Iphinoe sp. HA4291-MV1]
MTEGFGKAAEQPGEQYERDIQEFTGGTSQIIEGREIDSVTDEIFIQAKDSQTAITKPHNFLNKKTRSQIKETIRLAKELGKRAEFWFKQEPHSDVRQYIEDKEGIVIVWNKETE